MPRPGDETISLEQAIDALDNKPTKFNAGRVLGAAIEGMNEDTIGDDDFLNAVAIVHDWFVS
jgi:hypothetical protein